MAKNRYKEFDDNIKLKRVYYDALRDGDNALAEWAKCQLETRGVVYAKNG